MLFLFSHVAEEAEEEDPLILPFRYVCIVCVYCVCVLCVCIVCVCGGVSQYVGESNLQVCTMVLVEVGWWCLG